MTNKKILETYIRNVIFKSLVTEKSGSNINSKISKMINKLEEYKGKIEILDKGKAIIVRYISDNDNPNNPNSYNSKSIYGQILASSKKEVAKRQVVLEPGRAFQAFTKHSEIKSKPLDTENPCWYVRKTDETLPGMGPLLYDVLIEYITAAKKSSVKPDCFSVSDPASVVWYNYSKRDDITQHALDINKSFKDAYNASQKSLGRSEMISSITPNNNSDDTLQISALEDKGPEDLFDSHLSYSYSKDSTDVIEELKERNLIIMPSAKKNILTKTKNKVRKFFQ